MPELPEVENVRIKLYPIVGLTITQIQFNKSIRLRKPWPHFSEIKGLKITDIKRKGKYLFFILEKGYILINHLGMTGQFLLNDATQFDVKQKHMHVNIFFDNNQVLSYKDYRRFGMFDIYQGDLDDYPIYKKLGSEPFDFTLKHFKSIANKQKIKSFLLDQNNIAGVGNIYADEALFLSKINPTRNANTLNDIEIKGLIKNLVKILTTSIKNGGSTIKNYASLNGQKGNNQDNIKVYGKFGTPCPVCNHLLEKTIIGSRTTTFCSHCQV